MGQRLVINIYEQPGNGLPIANCYFHWDAYTVSSLNDLEDFLTAWNKLEIEDHKLRAVRAFERMGNDTFPEDVKNTIKDHVSTSDQPEGEFDPMTILYYTACGHAGLEYQSRKLMETEYPGEEFLPVLDRNCGLIAVEESEIRESMQAAEGTINIYLDNKTWDFDVVEQIDEEWYDELYEHSTASFEERLERANEIDIFQPFNWDQIEEVRDLFAEGICSPSGSILFEMIE